jgi:hypothetical protein
MSQGEFYISNKDGKRINPAIEENQSLIFNEAVASLSKNSVGGGTEVLTIIGNKAGGTNQACRSTIVWTDGSDVRMKIGEGDAAVEDFLMLSFVYLPVPVSNPAHLKFYGATNGAKVYILYRG